MINHLPKEFLEKMEGLLKEEFPAFLRSYQEKPLKGLRVNQLKLNQEAFKAMVPWELAEISWATNGYYYHDDDKPGKHPFHEAGLYYIQEPSAMSAAGHLEVQPGELVLDLCAAPGGKSTQLAAVMDGRGLLVSNEPYPARAKVLAGNIERMGIRNCVVTNELPNRLAESFKGFFDKILIDAPCSGEGMFRKTPEAVAEWSLDKVTECYIRQREILSAGVEMLKSNGRMVYSTCTFSQEENEDIVSWFLDRFPDFTLIESLRSWPHQVKGEGHFVAVFQRHGEMLESQVATEIPLKDKVALEYWEVFRKDYLARTTVGKIIAFGDQLYELPAEMIPLKGLRIVRPGLHLGTIKKKRFEPSHALALSLKKEEVLSYFDLSSEAPAIRAYLRGETLAASGYQGWTLITIEGYPLGWGKASGGIIKNHYPKGLRIM